MAGTQLLISPDSDLHEFPCQTLKLERKLLPSYFQSHPTSRKGADKPHVLQQQYHPGSIRKVGRGGLLVLRSPSAALTICILTPSLKKLDLMEVGEMTSLLYFKRCQPCSPLRKTTWQWKGGKKQALCTKYSPRPKEQTEKPVCVIHKVCISYE